MKEFNEVKVACYDGAKNVNQSDIISYNIGDILDEIKNGGKDTKRILRIRKEKDAKKRSLEKIKLLTIVFSASKISGARKDENVKEHSGFLVLDIDHLNDDEIDKTREKINNNKYTFVNFLSPSGNGFKVLIKIPKDIEKHKGYFLGIQTFYNAILGIKIDTTGINISRTCFVSYDPDIYINEESELFDQYKELKTIKRNISKKRIDAKETDNVALKLIKNTLKKKIRENVVECGQENKFHALKATARLAGGLISGGQIKEEDGIDYLYDLICEYDIIDDVGAMRTIEWGVDYGKEEPIFKERKVNFWYFTENRLGNQVCHIDSVSLENFLTYKKFKFIKTLDGIKLIQYNGKIMKIWANTPKLNDVEIVVLNNYLVDFLNEEVEDIGIKNTVKNLLGKSELNKLLKSFPIEKDDNIIYGRRYNKNMPVKLFFKNGFVSITKNDFIIDSYDVLDGHIFESDVIDYEIFLENYDFSKFEVFIKKAVVDFDAAKRIIGYLLAGKKNKEDKKGIFFIEKNIEMDESHGGSGKDLIVDAIGILSKKKERSGKVFDGRRNDAYQGLKPEDMIFHINDLGQKSLLSDIYPEITGSLEVKNLYQDRFTINGNDSPDFVITSNNIPGDLKDGSTLRRFLFVIMSGNFNFINTPDKDKNIGWLLGAGWGNLGSKNINNYEWNNFFLFMIECIQEFLEKGLPENTSKDIIISASDIFMDRAVAKYIIKYGRNAKYNKKSKFYIKKTELYDEYYDYFNSSYEQKPVDMKFNYFKRQLKNFMCGDNDSEGFLLTDKYEGASPSPIQINGKSGYLFIKKDGLGSNPYEKNPYIKIN